MPANAVNIPQDLRTTDRRRYLERACAECGHHAPGGLSPTRDGGWAFRCALCLEAARVRWEATP